MKRCLALLTGSTWALGGLLLLSSCRAILDIKTNAGDLDCAKLVEDAYCIKVRNGQINSVKDLALDQDKILSAENSFKLSWKMPETAKNILATKITLAIDAACSQEVKSEQVELQVQSYQFRDVKDGIYFGCLFAMGRAAGPIPAKNNGIRIVVDAAVPNIQAQNEVIYTNGRAFEQRLNAIAKSQITYIWTQVSGPGKLTFSNENAATPRFSATVDGQYVINVTVINEVGKKSSQDFSIVYDSTPPVIKEIAPILTAATTIAITAEGTEGLENFSWEVSSGPTTTPPELKGAKSARVEMSLPSNGTYMLKVSLEDLAGNIGSASVMVTKTATDPFPPSAPASMSVPENSKTASVAVSFTAGVDTNMSTHNLKACTANNCSTGCLAPTQSATSPATLSGLVNGSSYYICGQSLDLAGNTSDWSFTTGTVRIDTTAPTNPTAVSVPAGTTSSFNIIFTAGTESNPGPFNAKACTDSGCSLGCVGATTTASSPATIANGVLTPGTGYYGCVQGTDLAGNTSSFAPSAAMVVYGTFTIIYNGNGSTGGSSPADTATYLYGAAATAAANTGSLVKTGYSFGGWNTDNNGSGIAYSASQIFNITGNTTLYAQWTVSCSSLAGGTYVMVHGDSVYGTNSFCVQKYAASDVGSVPTSQVGTTPWVSIKQTDAILKCAALGAGFHLMTNPESMTLSTHLAHINSNWSGGAVGSGAVRRGHADNSPPNLCAADASDTNAYVETDCTGTSSGTFAERRTSTLGNGEVIWDIGGNVWNWVNYFNFADKPTPATAGGYEFTAITGSVTMPKSDLVPLNAVQPWWNNSWSSTNGVGKIYPNLNSVGGAMRRGGNWNAGTTSGLFGIALDVQAASAQTNISFRCAYTPNTFAVTYDGNVNTSGAPPNDPTLYVSGNTVTVKSVPVALSKANQILTGWNTAANGSGTSYILGQTFSIAANTTLYATWTNCSSLSAGAWGAVPGNSIYGTRDFCVQKHLPSNVVTVPTSAAGNTPWTGITQTAAITTCASLGAGYHLITNPEWMTIGANMANVASNWSGGAVGNGALRRGHSDNSPASICPSNALDANPYVETTCTGSSTGTFSERRTITLANGVTLWDFGGNAQQWVDYTNAADKPTPATDAWYEQTAITGSTATPKAHLVPLNSAQSWWTNSWNSNQGIGQIYPSTNGAGGSLVRGAGWGDSVYAGIFSASLVNAAAASSASIGFRCAYQP